MPDGTLEPVGEALAMLFVVGDARRAATDEQAAALREAFVEDKSDLPPASDAVNFYPARIAVVQRIMGEGWRPERLTIERAWRASWWPAVWL